MWLDVGISRKTPEINLPTLVVINSVKHHVMRNINPWDDAPINVSIFHAVLIHENTCEYFIIGQTRIQCLTLTILNGVYLICTLHLGSRETDE